jgi:hypothetical protein
MLKTLRRKIDYLSSSNNIETSSIFSSKLDLNKSNLLLGAVKEVDVKKDYIKIYLFKSNTEIEIPNQYEFGLRQNDLIVLAYAEGVYQILGKTNIEYEKDTKYIFNIKKGTLKEVRIKNKKIYHKDVHFEDIQPGEILKNIKVTGYRINEFFIDIFSGLTRATLTLSNILLQSFNIASRLINNKSIKIFKETDKKTAYDLTFITDKDNQSIFIEIKGDIKSCLSDKKITINKPPFALGDLFYLKIICTKTNNFKKRSKISHSYVQRQNHFVGEGDLKINSNVYDKINYFANSENLFEEGVYLSIDNETYFIKLMEINTLDGDRKIFSYNKTEIIMDDKNEYSNKNKQPSICFRRSFLFKNNLHKNK